MTHLNLNQGADDNDNDGYGTVEERKFLLFGPLGPMYPLSKGSNALTQVFDCGVKKKKLPDLSRYDGSSFDNPSFELSTK